MKKKSHWLLLCRYILKLVKTLKMSLNFIMSSTQNIYNYDFFFMFLKTLQLMFQSKKIQIKLASIREAEGEWYRSYLTSPNHHYSYSAWLLAELQQANL